MLLCFFLLCGTTIFLYRYLTQGNSWVSYSSNSHLYTNGQLNSGRILDRNGTSLASYSDGWRYSDDKATRLGTIFSVGDPGGQISTGALSAFAGKLTGYNLITGAGSDFTQGRDLYLTIDSELCAEAYKALGNYTGTIGVYNYQTGEILCMVSTPAYDPNNPDENSDANGLFINRFISSRFTPGSVFKLVTATAALDKLPDIETRTYDCTGSVEIGGYKVTCPEAHGTVTLEDALNVSCNCTFGQLAVDLGSGAMKGYTERTGLTDSYSIDGIKTRPSSFDFSSDGLEGLAWSGIGQGKDLVNPCAMMVFTGAIANGGQAAEPKIIQHTAFPNSISTDQYTISMTRSLIRPETASALGRMMKTDVEKNYGQENFPGLNICAKSGTAQVDTSQPSNGWFVGYLDDNEHPLAFTAMVEAGGSGAKSAGRLVNQVLQKAIDLGY